MGRESAVSGGPEAWRALLLITGTPCSPPEFSGACRVLAALGKYCARRLRDFSLSLQECPSTSWARSQAASTTAWKPCIATCAGEWLPALSSAQLSRPHRSCSAFSLPFSASWLNEGKLRLRGPSCRGHPDAALLLFTRSPRFVGPGTARVAAHRLMRNRELLSGRK